MERLQEAIARARQEREGEIGKLPPFDQLPKHESATGGASVTASGNGAPFHRRAARPVPGRIHYTRTRTVKLDPDTLEKHRVIAGRSDDRRVEAYRRLRAQVLQTLAEHHWRTLAITSPWENAGKTLTAVNMAITLSSEVNQTVLLVDLDLHDPSVHTTLGVDVEVGLIDVLQGNAAIEDTLFNPGLQRLVVLPGRPLGRPSSEFLTSPEMKSLLIDITARYDSRLIIFDLPPLLRNDDAMVVTPVAEATLMVVEAGSNTPDDVGRCMHMLKNANLIGTILNKAR